MRLFGGLEVSIGGEIVDPTSFVKQRSKTLLALLVLHRGKEVARQELLDILWPDSTGDRAVNNFYSLWSSLKAALACDSDEGPYVVRHQLSCMVDSRYVHSDVEEFEQLCRALFFGPVDVDEWLRIYTRLQDDFSCDLMPSETDTLYIVRLRERFRNRLVDAYITAADRLCDAGEPRAALWYAHAAVDAPAKREDAYCSLMRAQMLAGQRSLAMETFVECRTYMAEELGMDPSERVMSLHRELIACMREGSPVSKPDERSSAPDVLK